MRKSIKYILTILLVFSLITFVYFIYNRQSVGQTSVELSTRGRDFIGANMPDFKESGIVDNKNQEFYSDCFSFKLPYPSVNQKSEKLSDGCSFTARLLTPSSQIVLTVQEVSLPLESNSGVQFRRLYPNEHSEVSLNIPNFAEGMKFVAVDSVTYFFRNDKHTAVIAFTSLANPNNIKDEEVMALVESIQHE